MDKSKRFNEITKLIASYGNEDKRSLIHLLTSKGVTLEEIGKHLGITKQAVSQFMEDYEEKTL